LWLFKNILDDKENLIHETYKDKKCGEKQFLDAYKTIKLDNDNREKITPKPTHHVIIPFHEKITNLPNIIGEHSEQEMIYNFLQYIKESNIENCMELDFCIDFAKEFIQMFNKNDKNKMYNVNVFNNGAHYYDDNNTCNKLYRELKITYNFLNIKEYKDMGKTKNFKQYKKINENNFKRYKDYYTEMYAEYKDKIKFNKFADSNYSYNDFLVDNDVLEKEDFKKTIAIKQKCIFIPTQNITPNFEEYWKKTNIHYFKNIDKEKRKR